MERRKENHCMDQTPQGEYVEIDLREHLEVLWKRKLLILAVVLIFVAAAGINSYILTDSTYQAQSTLLILPPQYTTELEVGSLPIDTYRDLALSADIRQQIIEDLDLRNEGGELYTPDDLEEMMEIDIRGDYDPEGAAPEAPLMVLMVRGTEPEKLSQIANSWADQFIEASSEIRTGEIEEVTTVIREQFKSTEEELEQAKERLKEYRQEARLEILEDELNTKEKHLSKQTDQLISLRTELEEKKARYEQLVESIKSQEIDERWLGDLAALEREEAPAEAVELLTARNNYLDIQEEILAYKEENRIDLLEQEIRVLESNLRQARNNLASLRNTLEETRSERDKIAKLLDKEPKHWELERSMTGDALWSKALSPDQISTLQDLRLLDEIVNPLYEHLSKELSDRELALESIPEQIEYYKNLVAENEEELKRKKSALEEKKQGLDNLEGDLAHYQSIYRDHVSLYEGLKSDVLQIRAKIDELEAEATYYEQSRRELRKEVEDLQDRAWTHENRIDRLEQEVADLQRTYDMLGERREEARIAEAERTHDVKFVAEAVPPMRPIGPNRRLNVVLALVLGGMVGVFGAFGVEFFSEEEE